MSARKICNIISTVVLILVIVFAILLAGVRLFGIKPYTVLSGSMEPKYHVGSLIYVKSVDPNSLKKGDAVTFYLDGGTVATHRIIEVIDDTPGARVFRTQGDANDTPDSNPLYSSRIIGKPIFTIPYLGYFSNFLGQPAGRVFAIATIAFMMIFLFVPDLIFGKKKTLEEKPDDAENGESDENKAE